MDPYAKWPLDERAYGANSGGEMGEGKPGIFNPRADARKFQREGESGQ